MRITCSLELVYPQYQGYLQEGFTFECDRHMPQSSQKSGMTTLLIGLGIILIVTGIAWPWIQKLNLFHLPGDIVIRKENFSFYFPITTSILLSLALSVVIWLLSRFR